MRLKPSSHSAMAIVLMASTMLSSVSVHAQSVPDDRLLPRAEVSVKGGSERSNLTTEFWAPLAQKSGQVLYTDLRLMGDDDDNREGNLGFGYRRIVESTDSILGGNLWIDRRRTAANNTFHQVTVGVESLGKVIDLRANGYVPLNGGGDTVTTPNIGSTTPYLAGNGLFYDTNGSVTETPQYGVDAEVGYRVPVFQRYADTIRVYGGGYSFFRSNTEATTGYRVRTEAVINPVLSLGARFQHDAPRGDQGFLEATLRFPFSAKKLYQQKGLYGRLDESPERDIDIVTAKKVDTGLRKEITNSTTGEAQRIIYVDNSNTTATSDGTIEHPFSTLTAAQAALKANDILYIKAGTGTTTGMDQGITISQNNVSLIGSGSALTVNGFTFLNAGTAPVITNTQTYVDDTNNNIYNGNGIFVTAANPYITGITVNSAQGSGIFVLANNSNLNNVSILNNTANGSVNYLGIRVAAINGGVFNNVDIENNTANNNAGGTGVNVTASGLNTRIANTLIQNNTVTGSAGGIGGAIENGGQVGTYTINNNYSAFTVNGTNGNTYSITMDGGNVDTLNITNNTAVGSSVNGIGVYVRLNGILGTYNSIGNSVTNNATVGSRIFVGTGGRIDNANVQNLNSVGNGSYGALVSVSDAGSQINNLNISNIITSNNANSGVRVAGTAGGVINSAVFSTITSTNNVGNGVDINLAQSSIGSLNITDTAATGNTQNGIIASISTQSAIGQLSFSNVSARNNSSVGININPNNSTINKTILSNITTTNNTQYGMQIRSDNASVLSDVDISNVLANNNSIGGVYQNLNGGTIINSKISSITANNNGQQGIFTSVNAGSQITNLSIFNNALAGNGASALYTRVSGIGAVITTASVTGNTVTGTGTHGITVQADTSGLLNTITVSGNNMSSNTGRGLSAITQTNGQINNFNILNNTANSNGSFGMYVGAQSNSQITNTLVNGNITNTNSASGFYLNATGTLGVIANAVISNNISNNNITSSGRGFQVQNDTTSSINATVFHNTATGNTVNGLLIVKSGTGTFVVDAGGGALGSTGQNRISGNTGTEVRVDGGYALSARTNYWGGGDLVAGEKTLNGGSIVDSTGFLTVDPGP